MANVEVAQPEPDLIPEEGVDAKKALLFGLLALGMQGDDKSEYSLLKNQVRDLVANDPVDSLLATVLGGGLLFYQLEHGKNPRCNTYWDAVLYVATSLSVGYDDVFPKTKAGNALASLIQTFGPALAASAFAAPAKVTRAAESASQAHNAELLATNKAILARLEEISQALAKAEITKKDL